MIVCLPPDGFFCARRYHDERFWGSARRMPRMELPAYLEHVSIGPRHWRAGERDDSKHGPHTTAT